MAVGSSCREMWVKSRNERNLAFSCQRVEAGTLRGTWPGWFKTRGGETGWGIGPFQVSFIGPL